MADVITPHLTLTTGVAQQWVGGAGLILVSGTIGGATVDLYMSDDNTNWVAIGSQLTDVAAQVFAAPRGAWLKAIVTGGSPVLNINVYREAGLSGWVGTAGGSAGGGASGSVDIASISYKGQKTSAQSFPVVLASDYSISTSALDMVAVSGTISSAAVLSNFPKTDCTGLQGLAVQYTTVTAGNSAVVEESHDGTTWTAVNSILGAASVTAAGLHQYNISGKQVRVRCSVYASGSVAATAEFRALQFQQPLAYGSGVIDTRTVRMVLASDGTLPAFASTPTFNLGTLNGAATAAKQPALGTAGTPSADIITVQGAASMTPLAGNITQINGTALLAGAGNTGTGSPRCTIATDQAAIALWGHGVLGGNLTANATTVAMRTLAATPTDTTAKGNAPVLDLNGSQVVQPYGLGDNSISGLTAAMTGTTSTAVTGIGAPGSGLYNYITQLTVGNSHATQGTFVELQDGNGGTTFYTVPAAALYGGAVIAFPKPLKQPTANTALYAKNTTTGANVIVSASGYKGP